MSDSRWFLTRRDDRYLLLSRHRPKIVNGPDGSDAVPADGDLLANQHICHGFLRSVGLEPDDFELLIPRMVRLTATIER